MTTLTKSDSLVCRLAFKTMPTVVASSKKNLQLLTIEHTYFRPIISPRSVSLVHCQIFSKIAGIIRWMSTVVIHITVITLEACKIIEATWWNYLSSAGMIYKYCHWAFVRHLKERLLQYCWSDDGLSIRYDVIASEMWFFGGHTSSCNFHGPLLWHLKTGTSELIIYSPSLESSDCLFCCHS